MWRQRSSRDREGAGQSPSRESNCFHAPARERSRCKRDWPAPPGRGSTADATRNRNVPERTTHATTRRSRPPRARRHPRDGGGIPVRLQRCGRRGRHLPARRRHPRPRGRVGRRRRRRLARSLRRHVPQRRLQARTCSSATKRASSGSTTRNTCAPPGIGSGALFADLTNSGRLDLYVSQLRPRQRGRRGDARACCSATTARGSSPTSRRTAARARRGTRAAALAALDFDGDGLLDLLTCEQYYSSKVKTGPVLFRNKGGYRFENVAEASGLPVGVGGLGVAAADVNNDGWPDIFLTQRRRRTPAAAQRRQGEVPRSTGHARSVPLEGRRAERHARRRVHRRRQPRRPARRRHRPPLQEPVDHARARSGST